MNTKIIIALIAGVGIMISSYTCIHTPPASRASTGAGVEASSSLSSNGLNRREGALDMSLADNIKVAWKFLFGGVDRNPDVTLPSVAVDLSHFNGNGDSQLNATWLGHSSLMIHIDGCKILTDPVFERKISIVGPKRFNADYPMTIDALPDIDAVIISHDHYDHLNKWTIKRLNARTEKFIVPLGVGARLVKWGIPRERIVTLDWWETYQLEDKLKVTATPAQHFSGRGLFDRNKTLWASWVISGPDHKVFFSGDSGYFPGFKEIGKTHGPFDMTFLECGAYNLMWHKIHMLPEETVQAHIDLGGKILHPIHWGTFNLSMHPWYEPMVRITAAAALKNVELVTPVAGATTCFGHTVRENKWWETAMPSIGKSHPAPI